MNKKLISIFLATAMIASLTACKSGDPATSGETFGAQPVSGEATATETDIQDIVYPIADKSADQIVSAMSSWLTIDSTDTFESYASKFEVAPIYSGYMNNAYTEEAVDENGVFSWEYDFGGSREVNSAIRSVCIGNVSTDDAGTIILTDDSFVTITFESDDIEKIGVIYENFLAYLGGVAEVNDVRFDTDENGVFGGWYATCGESSDYVMFVNGSTSGYYVQMTLPVNVAQTNGG